jgi:hypothetical protein
MFRAPGEVWSVIGSLGPSPAGRAKRRFARRGGRVGIPFAISSDRQVDRLHYAVEPIGAERLVTVSSGGQEIRFRLRPADGYERQAFGAPLTPWRIASSVNALCAA